MKKRKDTSIVVIVLEKRYVKLQSPALSLVSLQVITYHVLRVNKQKLNF